MKVYVGVSKSGKMRVPKKEKSQMVRSNVKHIAFFNCDQSVINCWNTFWFARLSFYPICVSIKRIHTLKVRTEKRVINGT